MENKDTQQDKMKAKITIINREDEAPIDKQEGDIATTFSEK